MKKRKRDLIPPGASLDPNQPFPPAFIMNLRRSVVSVTYGARVWDAAEVTSERNLNLQPFSILYESQKLKASSFCGELLADDGPAWPI